jgi:hypothetical protein
MSFRPSQPVNRPALIALSLFAIAFVLAILAAATAHAAYYKTLYCGAADGSGNPVKGARPGFFDFTDNCGTARRAARAAAGTPPTPTRSRSP